MSTSTTRPKPTRTQPPRGSGKRGKGKPLAERLARELDRALLGALRAGDRSPSTLRAAVRRVAELERANDGVAEAVPSPGLDELVAARLEAGLPVGDEGDEGDGTEEAEDAG